MTLVLQSLRKVMVEKMGSPSLQKCIVNKKMLTLQNNLFILLEPWLEQYPLPLP
jgi:hypothetical protein